VTGEQLKRSIVPNSAIVFRYDIEYLLSEQLVSILISLVKKYHGSTIVYYGIPWYYHGKVNVPW